MARPGPSRERVPLGIVHHIMRAPISTVPTERLRDPALVRIAGKLAAGERLTQTDGVACFATNDLIGLGLMADAVNRAQNGDVVTFAANQHINPTNVCVLRKTCS